MNQNKNKIQAVHFLSYIKPCLDDPDPTCLDDPVLDEVRWMR